MHYPGVLSSINYRALPYYAYYTSATAPEIELRKDEVVVVERRRADLHVRGIQENSRERHAGPDKMGG